ncbi:MAG: hypothetical protein Q8P68_05120 [Candidatus Peregrinibacteria bacterium]|nr:hypothetical protein [Candidatus Peregrinibacteria bacterium]MDZ4244467.1 hypothetical protein [Candidatus Gracilibacteria bacterium]
MKKTFSKSVNLFLIISGILGGAAFAIAVAPFALNPPSANTTVVNFPAFKIGYDMDDVDGDLYINSIGQTLFNSDLPDPFTTDENGNLLPLRFGFDINSANAGLYTLGNYMGLKASPTQGEGLFGRVGVEGRVTATQATGGTGTARGFAGYLEYDPSLNPTVENDINFSTLPNSPNNSLFDDFIRISKGIPWAFYTENKSKFKDDVEITGNITSRNEPITFADLSGPVSDPVVQMNNGDLVLDDVFADNFSATGDLSEQFFLQTSDPALSMLQTYPNGNQRPDLQIISAIIYCPLNPTPSIRLGCGGAVITPNPTVSSAPYLGEEQISDRGCKSYARRPPGPIVPGSLSAYAFCWRPE